MRNRGTQQERKEKKAAPQHKGGLAPRTTGPATRAKSVGVGLLGLRTAKGAAEGLGACSIQFSGCGGRIIEVVLGAAELRRDDVCDAGRGFVASAWCIPPSRVFAALSFHCTYTPL